MQAKLLLLIQLIYTAETLKVSSYRGFIEDNCLIAPSYDGEDTIYLIGTQNISTGSFNKIWSYSISHENFTNLYTIEGGNSIIATTADNGNIYFFTKITKLSILLQKFSKLTKSVLTLKTFFNMNLFNDKSLTFVNGNLYIIANSNEEFSSTHIYKINSNSLEQKSIFTFQDSIQNAAIFSSELHIYVYTEERELKFFYKFSEDDLISKATHYDNELTTVEVKPFVIDETLVIFDSSYSLILYNIQKYTSHKIELDFHFTDKSFKKISQIFIRKKNALYIFVCQGRLRGCAAISINTGMTVEQNDPINVLEGVNVTMSCGVNASNIPVTYEWEKIINQRKPVPRGTIVGKNGNLEFKTTKSQYSGVYRCYAKTPFEEFSVDRKLTVIRRTTIKALKPVVYAVEGDNAVIECKVESDDSLKVTRTWYKGSGLIYFDSKSRSRIRNDGALVLLNVKMEDSGIYECSASTAMDNTDATFNLIVKKESEIRFSYTSKPMLTLNTDETENSSRQNDTSSDVDLPEEEEQINLTFIIILLILLLIIVLLTSALVLVICYWKRKNTFRLTEYELREFQHGIPIRKQRRKEVDANGIPYDKSYELPINTFDIYRDTIIGEGNFSVVYKGVVKGKDFDLDAAFKTTKYSKDNVMNELGKIQLKCLLSELKLLMYIGKHPNIVNLIGAYTSNLKEGIIFLALEYCSNGNLESFLRKCVICDANKYKKISDDSFIVSLSVLNMWSLEIVKGMEHISETKIVHSDLAARNILVSGDLSLKITDFGLSRQIESYSTYIKSGNEALPWRWMAIESLDIRNFSTQSDVWSFGVTLWEIFTLGSIPYPGESWTANFVQKLKKGERLPKPNYACAEMYEKMQECWVTEPSKRPHFSELVEYIQNICYKASNIVYVDTVC